MTSTTLSRLLDQLDEAKRTFGKGADKTTVRLLSRIAPRTITDAESLIRFHEILLFICAYPQSPRVRQTAESLLRKFERRVAVLNDSDVDISQLETPEVSGIAATVVSDTFSYPIVRWLVNREGRRVSLEWEWFEDENRLAQTWPRFMPLLEEDASVEANVPYKTWLQAASRGKTEVAWLVQQFESVGMTETAKTELYDSQKLYVRWNPRFESTRTGMRLPVRNIFYHRSPLIRRKDVSLVDELNQTSPVLERLSKSKGQQIIDMAREASTIRYRELYGFTRGDINKVFRTHLGRGVDLFLTAVPPGERLPLRAYHAALIFKNGIPVGYFEGLSLFERMESGFNLYYTFRDGETAWLYAKLLNVFRHLLGVTTFAIDPYQIGYENEEGIESGAFWFYRKLGFRPARSAITKIMSAEEDKLARKNGYRTSLRTLRKLAEGPMVFELQQERQGDWDRFHIRNVGLNVQRLIATRFGGDPGKFQARAIQRLTDVLNLSKPQRSAALVDFATVLALVPGFEGWRADEKRLLAQIIRAKSTQDESTYLKSMQKHDRLREAIIRLGSEAN